jgi:2-succinyl-5-enolpyruvyl-6-hydroxy-3-cyclohexene-1-carboxylate synthase
LNPSTAQAQVIVDELVRNGVRHVVLAPGSRNAPLSFALHAAERAGQVRLHVRVDERSAGFLGLGLAAGAGLRGEEQKNPVPVAVVCTSGTAAANLHPAVAEAYQSGVPLILLTTDRPTDLCAARASQTIDQHELYGRSVRWFGELAVAENRPGQQAYWRSQVCRAVRAVAGNARGGPVQLNLPFREPLVPTEGQDWCEPLDGRPGGRPWTVVRGGSTARTVLRGVGARRGLVIAADGDAEAAGMWGMRHGWPVLSETGGAGASDAVLGTGMWLLGLAEFVQEHRPEQVLCAGRPTVFRQVHALLSDPGVEVLLAYADPVDWPAPGHNVREVAESFGVPNVLADPDWLTSWQQADDKASAALHSALDVERWPNGPAVARDVLDGLPTESLLVLGSSNPTRDVALAARRRPDVVVHRNRGVAGIDGMVSTAIGAALASERPAYALVGDLTFVHDSNGLVLGPYEHRPDLTIVVFNDDGGGIFSLLEQGGPEYGDAFERVFGTPHGTEIGRLCAAHGVAYTSVRQRSEFVEALQWRPGLRVIEVRSDRHGLRDLHQRLRAAVRSAVLG